MYIEKVIVKNFRNFENIEIETNNKNVLVGLNDVGKTNLLYAIRKIFDSKLRIEELVESDFYNSDTSQKIEIQINIDFSFNDNYRSIILANIGALRKNKSNKLAIRYSGEFEKEPIIEWTVFDESPDKFEEVKSKGIYKTKIDDIFKVTYIDSQMKFETTMRQFKREQLRIFGEENFSRKEDISDMVAQINNRVKELKEVKALEEVLSKEIESLDTDFTPIIRSNIAIEGIHNSLEIYTHDNADNSDKVYPTAGDGKKKLVEYAMYNSLINLKENEKYIPIVIIEEPENHLHISIQLELLKLVNKFSNFFISTHSAEIIYELEEDTNIIRVSKNNENSVIANSNVYKIPVEFYNIRHMYQRDLIKAIFYETVFLVEGYSEKLLWEYALNQKGRHKQKKYILNIIGVDFEPYYNFLTNLGIKVYIRTDNDIKKTKEENIVEASGISRLQKLLQREALNSYKIATPIKTISQINDLKKDEKKDEMILRWNTSKAIYECSEFILSNLNENNLFLARIDFENDVIAALNEEYDIKTNYNAVSQLQKSKWHELITSELGRELFTDESIEVILNSEYFSGLKRFINE